MSNFGKNLALWIVIGILVLALFQMFTPGQDRSPESTLAFSDFVAEVDSGEINDVTITGNEITGHFSDGRSFRTYAPDDPNLVERLNNHGVRISAAPPNNGPSILSILIGWFPFLLLIAVWISPNG